jgi:hypothetical protein
MTPHAMQEALHTAHGAREAAYDAAKLILQSREKLTRAQLGELDRLLDEVGTSEFAALMADGKHAAAIKQFERYEALRAWPIYAGFGTMLAFCLIGAIASSL